MKRGTVSNVVNRTLFTADNLDIMRGMNSESVDLIYLDPPFNSNKTYAAPVGSEAAGAAFKDSWTLSDVDLAWVELIAKEHPAVASVIDASGLAHGASMKAYLTMMAVRLLEMRRLLKPTGSIYLHCDDAASHWLKALLDASWGHKTFRNEIIWKRTSNHNDAQRFGRTADRLLFYGPAINRNGSRVPLSAANVMSKYRREDERGTYTDDQLTGPGLSDGESGKPWRGYDPGSIGRCWSVPRTGDYAAWIEANLIPGYRAEESVMARLDLLERASLIIFTSRGTPRLKRYLAASEGKVPSEVWTDIPPVNSQAKERTGYPTQKPIALLERVVRASSNEGDLVLDPFCGCATALVAAKKLHRNWIGIDLSPRAVELVKLRLDGLLGSLYRPDMVTHRTDIPVRTDLGDLPPYRTHRHSLYGAQEGFCNGCEHHFMLRNLTVDHIIPRSRGGSDNPDNLQLLCGACNSMKGTKDQAAFLATLSSLGKAISRSRNRARA